MLRDLLCLSGMGLVAWLGVCPVFAQEYRGRQSTKPGEQIERLFDAIISGKEFDGDMSGHVPVLIQIVEDGDPESCTLALRALARMKSNAASATGRICKRLSDPSHSIRSAAVDALVAIGESAVAPLQKLMTFSSPKTRACAGLALSRLNKLGLPDLERLAADPDPRVRAVAADGLSRLGKPGVPLLGEMLHDKELAVAVEAARALQANREDPSTAVAQLIKALPRAELGWAAGRALAAYGVEARRAVPWIIKAYPLGEYEPLFGWEDATEVVLKHIGPADARDIPFMCESLAHKDPEVRILAAENLALMGIQGEAAAQSLEEAAEASIREGLALERKSGTENAADDAAGNSGHMFDAAQACATAVWRVTHDARRFVAVVVRLVLAADRSMDFQDPTPWQDFSADDCRSLEDLLAHANDKVRLTAMVGRTEVGAPTDSLRKKLLGMARGADADYPRLAIRILSANGPSAAAETAPVILSMHGAGTLPLEDFADAVRRLKIPSPEFQELLEQGLGAGERKAVMACARALCATPSQPNRIAALLIDSTRNGQIRATDAIEIMNELESAANTVIPYLSSLLEDPDHWTCHSAINALGRFGRKAAAAVPSLERLLENESRDIHISAAKTIYLVAGDPLPFDNELQAAFSKAGREDIALYFTAIKAISELGPSGTRFLPYLLNELPRVEPEDADSLIDALAAIGGDEAVTALESIAKSTDWMLRSQAIAALRKIRKSDQK